MAVNRIFPEVSRSKSWSPMRELSLLHRRIDRMFDEMMEPSTLGGELFRPSFGEWEFVPACDIEETATHYLVSFDLPGVSKNDVRIELRDHQLVVSGERRQEKEGTEGPRVSRERYHGAFQRVMTLPLSAEPEKVEANYESGVLQIVVPKSEAAKPKSIPIKEEKGGIFSKLLPQKKAEKAA